MKFEIETCKRSFCPGVKRASRIATEILSSAEKPVYSIGPLIHNPREVKRLQKLGLEPIELKEETDFLRGKKVIIRSHGIDEETLSRLEKAQAKIIDATCPKVKRAQNAARELSSKGLFLLILGSNNHPEVRSLISRAKEPLAVIENAEDAKEWLSSDGRALNRAGVVCQTTIPRKVMEEITQILEKSGIQLVIKDTICEDVSLRQTEALEICSRADAMIIVGGKNSSNTTNLARICASTGTPTFHIEEPSELRINWFEEARLAGVVAGASTPSWQIDEVIEKLRNLDCGN
ncbi:MAG: 4-hydroxy-3-methylbut-2-enyl diphosphate reductase [Actinomycetota bacterium]|nr:4-hydroxy-3-methylbut-2-enyl diphosphate reductase [Actinomycetota bacterium]